MVTCDRTWASICSLERRFVPFKAWIGEFPMLELWESASRSWDVVPI